MPNNSACLQENQSLSQGRVHSYTHMQGKPLTSPSLEMKKSALKLRIDSSHFQKKYNTFNNYDNIIFFQEIWNNLPLFLHAGVFIRNVNKVCDQNTKHIATFRRELWPSLLHPSGIQQCSSCGLIFLSDFMVILQRQTDRHTCRHICT